jgi:hypothetical protein
LPQVKISQTNRKETFMFKAASILLSAALTASPAYAEEVYKSVDEHGVPTFSDTQTEGAKKITVEPVNVQPAPELAAPPATNPVPKTEASHSYTKLHVISPEDQASLRDEHSILFRVALEPSLQKGHKIEFLDNGKPLQAAGESASMELLNFDRGTHQLSARVIDKQGKTIKTSNTITVYIFRTAAKPNPPKNGG